MSALGHDEDKLGKRREKRGIDSRGHVDLSIELLEALRGLGSNGDLGGLTSSPRMLNGGMTRV
jgi:hypothetical protein